jgi:hypothetical protein
MKTRTPRAIVDDIKIIKQRHAMATLLIRMTETCRDDFFPNLPVWDFFMLMVIIDRIYLQHEMGRAPTESELARVTQIPRQTLHRKLQELVKKWGALTQDGRRYVLKPEFMNSDCMIEGFRKRRYMLLRTPLKTVVPPETLQTLLNVSQQK